MCACVFGQLKTTKNTCLYLGKAHLKNTHIWASVPMGGGGGGLTESQPP